MNKQNDNKIKLLLVEDDKDFSSSLVSRLAKRNFEVTAVFSAEEALDKLKEIKLDAIVVDIRLPGMDGITFLAKARAVNKDLPVILITGYASLESAKEAVTLNATDYLLKPLEGIDELLNPVYRAVYNYRLLTENKSLMDNLQMTISKLKNSQQKYKKAYEELKETQKQLIQSVKMATLGQLAAGISHELNHPLHGIKGFTQAALEDLDKSNPLRDDLNKIIKQAERMDKIIKNVSFFARKSEFKMEDININKPIEDSLTLLSDELKRRNIRLKKSLDKGLPTIKGDPNQLQQVFLNLITNARDAIDSLELPEGGEVFVKTSLSKCRNKIEVTFKDAGCGIPKQDLNNIFDPFFTTKSPKRGIGLGLSIVRHILENHKGAIEVESEKGKGSIFKIILPLIK